MLNNIELKSLVEKYGTPIYVVDESELDKNQAEINSAFSILSIPVSVAYPYKANSLPSVIEYMHRHGNWAEVASALEMNLALNIGLDPKKIILNAPYKPIALLRQAVSIGCKIHVDNEQELITLSSLVDEIELTNRVEIGLRISTPGNSLWSRFGFRSTEWSRAIRIIKNNDKLNLIGLHTHRSNIANLDEYQQHIDQVFALASTMISGHDINLEYLDIGSGFAIDWPRPSEHNNWSAPSINEYAEIVERSYRKWTPNIRQIIIEPGRRSVASSAYFLTKIVSTKTRGDTRFVVSDGALNFIPGAEIYRYRISLLDFGQSDHELDDAALRNVLCGCLCDSLDVIDPELNIKNLKLNQVIKIDDVGGYDIARSFVWQLPYPPIIWASQGNYKIIYK